MILSAFDLGFLYDFLDDFFCFFNPSFSFKGNGIEIEKRIKYKWVSGGSDGIRTEFPDKILIHNMVWIY